MYSRVKHSALAVPLWTPDSVYYPCQHPSAKLPTPSIIPVNRTRPAAPVRPPSVHIPAMARVACRDCHIDVRRIRAAINCGTEAKQSRPMTFEACAMQCRVQASRSTTLSSHSNTVRLQLQLIQLAAQCTGASVNRRSEARWQTLVRHTCVGRPKR